MIKNQAIFLFNLVKMTLCFCLSSRRKVNVGEYITGGDDVPHDFLRQADGQIGIEETGIRVPPLPADIVSDETLAMASAQLISEHLQISSNVLLLAQVCFFTRKCECARQKKL